MTAETALRYLAYKAAECRERDAHEALCLLHPAILTALGLQPMDQTEASAFRYELREALNQNKKNEPACQPARNFK